MPTQEEHDQPENLVESPGKAEHVAHSLEDAADSNTTLQGYYAMHNIKPSEDIEKEVTEERKTHEGHKK